MSGLESSGKSDSGTTSRVLGTLLTWFQDTKSGIYKVATCNSIRNLDAPFLRKGRWDEIFSVDLPSSEERKQIFQIHLSKRGRNPQDYDLVKLAELSDAFVGAEIEGVVSDALFLAFDKGRELCMEDLEQALSGCIPVSRTCKEEIGHFRTWIKDRAVPVSRAEVKETAATKAKRTIRGN